jgi:hypothetical protein
MSYELLEKFTNFTLPTDLAVLVHQKLINIPLNTLKMFSFADTEKIKNEDIDYWMSIGPARQKDESFTEYKDRQKFQRALERHRAYIYNYNALSN